MFDSSLYTIGWVCALETEHIAAAEHLDEEYEVDYIQPANDNNSYVFGRIGNHHIVIATLPKGEYGTSSAASVARDLVRSFTNIRVGLMVGIGGGAPARTDIRLGDVVVSVPKDGKGGVWQYDYGKLIQGEGFKVTGHLNSPPQCLLTAMNVLGAEFKRKGNGLDESVQDVIARNPKVRSYQRPDSATDCLYKASFLHTGSDCSTCSEGLIDRKDREEDVVIHEGVIASANQLMKDATIRDILANESGVLCFEMEAAGLMNQFPFLVVRGICDYSDTHKNTLWQGYAAMAAAAYAKKLLLKLAPTKVAAEASLSSILENLSESIAGINRKLQKQTARAIRADIDAWLAAPDPDSNLQTSLQLREPGTGAWIVESDKYQQWKAGTIRHLWLHGKAGCGKSVISGTIIEDVRKHCETASDVGSAMFYFTFSDTNKQSYVDCLISLIRQLAVVEPVSSKLQDLYGLKGARSTPAGNLDSLQKMLDDGLRNYKQFYLIFDALDEVPEFSKTQGQPRKKLINWIGILCKSIPQLQILATSRHLLDIEEEITNVGFIPMSMVIDCVNNDIKLYVINQLNGDRRLRKLNEQLKQKVQDMFVEKADGMFRWAYCQISNLNKNLRSTQPSDFDRVLKNLPADLDETYDRILAEIPMGLQDRAINLLRWLAYSQRPMKLLELSETRIIDLEGERGHLNTADRGSPEDVLEILSSLIITTSGPRQIPAPYVTHSISCGGPGPDPSKVQRRVRSAVKKAPAISAAIDTVSTSNSQTNSMNAVISDPKSVPVIPSIANTASPCPEASLALTTVPVTNMVPVNQPPANVASSSKSKSNPASSADSDKRILLLPESNDSDSPRNTTDPEHYMRLAHFSIQEYLESERILTSPASTFHLDRVGDEQVLAESCATYLVHYSEQKQEAPVRADFDTFPLLRYAADHWHHHCQEHGQFSKIMYFLQTKSALHAWTLIDNLRTSPWASKIEDLASGLHYAAKFGLNTVAQRLIGLGADVNAVDARRGTPLQIASSAKHALVVETLVDAGANVNSASLLAAIETKDIPTIKILVKSGADVNTPKVNFNVPLLVAAAEEGNLHLVQTLVQDGGADVNIVDGSGKTALIAASEKNYMDIVEFLLKHKANINANSRTYGTALARACAANHSDLAALLIAHQADMDIELGSGGTALTWSITNGYRDIINLLIEHGANINVSPKQNSTALITATSKGDVETVRLLIERGADIDALGGSSGTALIAAALGGNAEIFNILIQHKADVNLKAGNYGTALIATALGGHIEIFNTLIQHKADVNLKAGDYGTPLIAATFGNSIEIAEMLIQLGADIDAQAGDCGSALIVAAKAHNTKLVQLLLERGADINQRPEVCGIFSKVRKAYRRGPQDQQIYLKDNQSQVVKLLLEHGADINTQESELTLLQMACNEPVMTSARALASYLRAEFAALSRLRTVAVKISPALTVLQTAVTGRDATVVKMLIEHGANINAEGPHGTALELAIENDIHDAVCILVENGANVNAKGKHGTALELAMRTGHADTIEILLAGGADVDVVGEHGSPLGIAMKKGFEDVVQLLEEYGATMIVSPKQPDARERHRMKLLTRSKAISGTTTDVQTR